MKKILRVVCGILLLFCCLDVPAAWGQTITVEATGSDTTKSKALHDAMRRAIVKAVGAYVATKTTLRDDQRNKEIIVNSDATVTHYKTLSSEEKAGIWTVKIKAEVLPNEYLKYCPQTVSQKVSTLETGTIVNRRKALRAASQTLHGIFQDYSLYLYRLSRIGQFKVADNDDFNSDIATVTLDFKIRIDQKIYRKIQQQLCSLLDSIALQKVSHKFSLNYDISRSLSATCEKLKKDAGSEGNNAAFVLFMEYSSMEIDCKLYLVQRKLLDILSDTLNSSKETVICSLRLKDKEDTEKHVFTLNSLRFYEREDDIITFCNKFQLRNNFRYKNEENLSVKDQNFQFQTTGTMTMRIAAENFDTDKIKDLKLYALFLKDSCNTEKLNEIASDAEVKIFVNAPDTSHNNTTKPDSGDSADLNDSSAAKKTAADKSWVCPKCNGKKVVPQEITLQIKCKNCNGKGKIRCRQFENFDPHNFNSTANPYETCSNCSGRGRLPVKRMTTVPCPECSK